MQQWWQYADFLATSIWGSLFILIVKLY